MSFPRATAVDGFGFGMINKNNGSDITSGVEVYITKDDGVQAAVASTPVYKGNGQWTVDLTAEEMNAVIVSISCVHDDAITQTFTIRTLGTDDLLSPPTAAPTPGGVDIAAMAAAPFRTRTNEGSVQERTIDELIKADRYVAGAEVEDVPWGIRLARAKPGSALGPHNDRG